MSQVNWFNWNVPDTTSLYIRGWMQMVFYYHMIYSPKTNNQGKTLEYIHTTAITIYIRVTITISQYYVLCAWWVLDVTSSPSGSPPGSPMDILSPQLLQINCSSCSRWVGQVPPPPPTHGDLISLRVHALPHLPVRYMKACQLDARLCLRSFLTEKDSSVFNSGLSTMIQEYLMWHKIIHSICSWVPIYPSALMLFLNA
jgi:hypothetical protein